MKKLVITGMLLGLLTGVAFAQRGRPAGPVSPTARPDVDMSARRTAGASPTAGVSPTMGPSRTTTNQGVSPTAAPIKDPTINSSTTANGTTTNQSVEPTPAPIRDPLVGESTTTGTNTTVDRNVSPTAAPPIRDPK
jgi:hypothetical protein